MNVITQAIATTAPLDCELECSVLEAESSPKVYNYSQLLLGDQMMIMATKLCTYVSK